MFSMRRDTYSSSHLTAGLLIDFEMALRRESYCNLKQCLDAQPIFIVTHVKAFVYMLDSRHLFIC
jgi:hypothetical protein